MPAFTVAAGDSIGGSGENRKCETRRLQRVFLGAQHSFCKKHPSISHDGDWKYWVSVALDYVLTLEFPKGIMQTTEELMPQLLTQWKRHPNSTGTQCNNSQPLKTGDPVVGPVDSARGLAVQQIQTASSGSKCPWGLRG